MGRTHYDVLGITPDASLGLIRAAYKARIRESHPDAGGDPNEAARVNEAFAVLGEENARASYDGQMRTARSSAPPAEPSHPAPRTQPAPDEPFRPTSLQRMPLWRRGRTARIVAIAAGAWLAAAGAACVFATRQADAFDVAQPAVAGFLTAALPVAIAFMILTRARVWLTVAASVGYHVFASSQFVGGYGTVMLGVTLAASITIRLALRHARKLLALELAGDFWAACANPALSGWFISRSLRDQQTTFVQLVDVTGAGRPETSATLWGHHPAGNYVIADMAASPSPVLLSMTSPQMAWAAKSRK